jgi:cytochrome c-type biogenesis protein CcmF
VNELLTRKAEPWTYALGSSGKAFIFLAIALCLCAAVSMLIEREKLGRRFFTLGALSFVGAFGCLLVLFLTHQFQFKYVFDHSALDHEVQYLVAGVWSGQEGSFLLWGVMASVVGVFAVRGAGEYRKWFTVVYSLFLSGLAGILAFESPFKLLEVIDDAGKMLHVVPPEGRGLVPSLLNYWIVIHPPTIFLGFGVLTVLFAYAFAAVLKKDVLHWIPLVRPWAVFALAILGVGLCMGGFWAYETLGWGGFWMWDPVENTSFVPWCAVVAFVHAMFVQQARKKWFLANVLFGALPFVLFCYGTFLTRSGYLGDTSVHSFAEMNPVARWLLVGLSAASLIAFVVATIVNWGKIAESLPKASEIRTSFFNRETFYGIGVWLIWALSITTALGMSVPLLSRLVAEKPKVVEEQLYHQVLAWGFVPLMLAMAVAPFLTWKGLTVGQLMNRIINCIAITIGMIGFILLWMKSPGFHAPAKGDLIDLGPFGKSEAIVSWVLFLTGICLFVAVASFWRMMESLKKSTQTVGAMLAHFGLAIAMLGLVFSRGFEKKAELIVHPSESPTAFGYSIEALEQTSQFSDRNNRIPIRATSPNDQITATPTLYYYMDNSQEPKPMAWPSIVSRPLYDYYFAIAEPIFEATDWTDFVLTEDPVNQPDLKAHRDVALMYTGYEVKGSIAEDGESLLTAKIVAVMDDERYDIAPSIRVRLREQPEHIEARIGDRYRVTLGAMDPKTHAIKIKLDYVQPAYPVVIYFKPLTLLVWLGVGIMTVGGLLSAATRRRERQATSPEEDAA